MNSLPNLIDPILYKSTSQPEFYDRSSSSGLLSTEFRFSSGNALINAQPQDFVVVDGKKFRVIRSPRALLQAHALEGIPAIEKFDPLKKALDNANSIIAKQNDQILKQVRQIESLTQRLNSEHINEDNRRLTTGSSISSEASNDTDTWHSAHSSRSSSGTNLAARRRAEVLESGQKLSDLSTINSEDIQHDSGVDIPKNIRSPRAITVRTCEPECSGSASTTDDSPYDTPSNINSFSGETKFNHKNIDRSPSLSDISLSPPPVQMLIPITPNKGDGTGTGTGTPGSRPPKGLAARLAMGSQDRRKLNLGRRKLINSPVPVIQALESSPSPTPMESLRFRDDMESINNGDYHNEISFKWKLNENLTSTSSSSSCDVNLFIAHDNPQVGSTVATRLRTEGPMHIMLESKEDSGLVCIILGCIVYSGRIEGVECADLENPRGSQFIVCSKMTAIKVDIATLPTRTRGDILEIDLKHATTIGRIDITTELHLKSFLYHCTSRVEVILDPSHTQMWYPYWEGQRKMAPQFRSQGVGYIRLGDEMSNYGSAFLSLDAGLTYLDDGKTSIVADKNYDNSPAMLRTFPGGLMQHSDEVKETNENILYSATQKLNSSSKMRSIEKRRSRLSSNSFDMVNDEDKSVAVIGSTSAPSSFRRPGSLTLIALNKEFEEGKEALQLLSDPDYKWADRVEALRRLHTVIINIQSNKLCDNSDIPSELLTEMISSLILCVTKQKNPHVLRSAVCCIRVLAVFASNSTTCNVVWKTLLLETIHLLRVSNKPVYEEVKDMLIGLQNGAAGVTKWTLNMTILTPMLCDIFAGPRGKGSGGASNSSKVVNWLELMICNEINNYMQYLCYKAEGLEYNKLCERADIGNILLKCYQLLLHREEITRDAAVSLTGSLLVYDVLQLACSNSNSTHTNHISSGWNNICALSLAMSAPVKLIIPVRNDLSKKEKDSGLQIPCSASDGLFLSSISTVSASALSNLSKENHRMHERVLFYATKLLASEINNIKINQQKNSKKIGNSGGDLHSDSDVTYGQTEYGIAFRSEKEKEKELNRSTPIDSKSPSPCMRKRSLSFNDRINNNSEETKLSSIGEKRERATLSADWFELRLILKEIPRNENKWANLAQVKKVKMK